MNESFDPNSLVIAVHEHCLFLFLHRAGRCMVSMKRSVVYTYSISVQLLHHVTPYHLVEPVSQTDHE